MNLSTVKSIAVPEGNVMALSIGGIKVWSAGSGGDEPAELLSWEGVAYHINKGTYKDVYAIGDMVPLDLGSQGLINMQIAAFDVDTLADGSGTAAISWVAKELLKTSHRMNPKKAYTEAGSGQEGTGSYGGWEKCEMRTYLQNTIKPMIPTDVASMICEVTKTRKSHNNMGNPVQHTVSDEVWLPAKEEVVGVYAGLFPDANARKKGKVGASAIKWWCSDVGSRSEYFACIDETGDSGKQGTAQTSNGVCLGFCTGRTPT